MNDLALKLRKLLSESRKIPLRAIKLRDIQRFLKNQPNIHWRPDHLLEDTQNRKYAAFTIIYEAESFTGILSQEVEKAMKNNDFDFFYILENDALLDIFEEPSRQRGFGIILNSKLPPALPVALKYSDNSS